MQFLSMYIADQKRWFLKKNMIFAIFMIQIINNLVLFREIPRVSETDVLSALILSVDDPFFLFELYGHSDSLCNGIL